MTKPLIICFIVATLISCNGPQAFVDHRLIVAEKFIECLKNNESDKILEFSYSSDNYNLKDKETRDFNVGKASNLINRFRLPSRNNWIIKYDPKNNFERLLVIIPIFNGYDSVFNLIKANIILKFPPPEISDKVYDYEIETKYDITKMKPTIAPPSIDSAK